MEGTGTLDTESIKNIPKDFDVVVVNMDKILFEGKAKSVIAPGSSCSIALLPGHTPIFAKLVKGKLVINSLEKNLVEIEVDGGIIKATQQKIVILVGFAPSK